MKTNFLPVLKNFVAADETLQNKDRFTLEVIKDTITDSLHDNNGLYVFDIEGKNTLSRFVLYQEGWIDFTVVHIETEKTEYFRNTKAETESHLEDILRGCITSMSILENTL